jgi:hypothetical protein
MLKRDGKPIPYTHPVPGFSERLDDAALASYKAAFASIERGYQQIENVKQQLDRLRDVRWEPAPFETLTAPDGEQWQAVSSLTKSLRSDVFLCHGPEKKEWAVVQRLNSTGPYVKSHGDTTVLTSGHTSPRQAVEEYVGQAEHTLRFMSRNLVAQAQQVVWEQRHRASRTFTVLRITRIQGVSPCRTTRAIRSIISSKRRAAAARPITADAVKA